MTERVEVLVSVEGVDRGIKDILRLKHAIESTQGEGSLATGNFPSLQGHPREAQIRAGLLAAEARSGQVMAARDADMERLGSATQVTAKTAIDVANSNRQVANANDALVRATNERARDLRRGELQNVREQIYERGGLSTAELDYRDARRAAQSRVTRARSDQRLAEIQDPTTSFGRRLELELGGTTGRIGEEIKKGFFNIRPPGEQMSLGGSIGQASRFTLLYGSLYSGLRLLTEGVAAASQEVLAYADAMATLSVATNQSAGDVQQLGSDLGNIAVNAGFAPSAGAAAGAVAIGAFGAAQEPKAVQDAVAKGTVEVASRIAAIAGTDLGETTQQLAGVARSLNLTTEQLPGLEDELTYVSRQIGRPVGELLSAIAQLGTLGAGAGFTPEELAAVIGQVTATTGQTPESASGSFRQVLSRADDPNFQAKIEEQFGIKAVGVSLRDIFAEFAALSPDSEQVNRFSLLFGRGASQQVAQILAQNFDTVQGIAGGARGAAGTGIGQEQFNTIMDNIGGLMRRLSASLLDLANDLAQTGILDALGFLAMALLETVKAVDQVIEAFNLLPHWARTLMFALIELQLAIKATRAVVPLIGQGLGAVGRVGGFTGSQLTGRILRTELTGAGLSALFGGYAGAGRVAPLAVGAHAAETGRLAALVGGAAGATRAAETAVGTHAATAAGAGGFAAARAAVLAINPVIAIFGVLTVAALTFKNSLQAVDAVWSGLNDNMSAIITARTSEQAQAAVERARQNARAAQQLTDAGLFSKQTLSGQTAINVLSERTGIGGVRGAQQEARDQLAYAEQQQRVIDATAEAAKTAPVAAFTDFTNLDSLKASFEVLGSSGYTASQQVDALIESFDRLAVAGEESNQVVLHAAEFAELSAIGGGRGLQAGQLAGLNGDQTGNLQQIVQTTLAKGAAQLAGPNGDLVLDDEAKATLTTMVETAIVPILAGLPEETREAARNSLMNGLRITLDNWGAAAGAGGVSAQSISNFLQQGFAASQAGIGSDTVRTGSAREANRLNVERLDGLLAAAREKARGLDPGREGAAERAETARIIAQYETERKAALQAYGQAATAEGQAFTAVAQSRLATDDLVGRSVLGVLQATRDLMTAIQGGDVLAIAQAQAALNDEVAANAKNVLDATNAQNLVGVDPRNQQAQLAAQLENARRTLASQDPNSAAYAQTQVEIANLQRQQIDLATATANAEASAGIAGNQSQIAAATVALDNAARTLADQLPGTKEYWDALTDLRQRQYELAEAEAAYADTQRRLSSDITDPVEQAKLDVQAAREKLDRDRASGQGPDVIAQDQLDLKRARAAEEQAAFQQRLSDAQTAEQLGRSSHQAYMNYLQNEHDRLSAIKNRTRQQQEQLDIIDQAILSAQSSMAGQFNLGDIKVPTPYEVRRYIEAVGDGARATATGRGAISHPGGVEGAQTINHINIDGADTAAVERILRGLINGSSVATATTKTRRKRG